MKICSCDCHPGNYYNDAWPHTTYCDWHRERDNIIIGRRLLIERFRGD